MPPDMCNEPVPKDALAVLKQAEALARQAGGRLLVFGSIIEGGFGPQSDIDLLLLDVAAPDDWDVAVKIDTMVSLAGFRADVMPVRFVPESLKSRALANGCEPSALG